MMIAAVGCPADLLRYSAPADFAELKSAGEKYGLATLLAAAQILDQSLVRMRQSVHTRTLAELAIVRLCRLDELDDLAELAAELKQAGLAAAAPAAPPASASSRGLPRRAVEEPKKKRDVEASAPRAGESAAASAPNAARGGEQNAARGGEQNAAAAGGACGEHPQQPLTPETADDLWRQTLEIMADMTADSAAFATRAAILAPNRLAVFFPAKYNAQKAFCERPEKQAQIERALARLTGESVRIEFRTLDDGPVAPSPPPSVPTRQRMREAASHPLVQQAIELFDAEVLHVEPPRRPAAASAEATEAEESAPA
jgi:DNA polymerase-3 subunit gamma/tau